MAARGQLRKFAGTMMSRMLDFRQASEFGQHEDRGTVDVIPNNFDQSLVAGGACQSRRCGHTQTRAHVNLLDRP
jgi:hypothetical protein